MELRSIMIITKTKTKTSSVILMALCQALLISNRAWANKISFGLQLVTYTKQACDICKITLKTKIDFKDHTNSHGCRAN